MSAVMSYTREAIVRRGTFVSVVMGFRVSILRRSSGGVAGVSGECSGISSLLSRVPLLWLLIFHSFEASRALPHSSVSLSGVDVILPLRNDSI